MSCFHAAPSTTHRFHVAGRSIIEIRTSLRMNWTKGMHGATLQKTNQLRRLFQTVVDNSLLTREGDDHRAQRRLLAPLFQPRTVAAHAAMIREETLAWLAGWHATPQDLAAQMQTLSLRLNHRLLFGSDHAVAPAVLAAWRTITATVNQAVTQVVVLPSWMPTVRQRRFRAACQTLDDALIPLIQRRRHAPTPHDLISHVLTAAEQEGVLMTDADVRDQVMAFFIAGHEPLAAALTWTWIVLATQSTLTEQLQSALRDASDDAPPALLTQTLSEVLRLYPPVYVVTRRVIAPIDLPQVGTLPVGLSLGISPFVVQRNPQWYPNPNRFDPARKLL